MLNAFVWTDIVNQLESCDLCAKSLIFAGQTVSIVSTTMQMQNTRFRLMHKHKGQNAAA